MPAEIILKKDISHSDNDYKYINNISEELLNKIVNSISNEVESRIIKILKNHKIIK